jgi:glycerophosphoryl diester phosphodiesterase
VGHRGPPPVVYLPWVLLLDPTRRPVIGHRGNRAYAPENTLRALTDAAALGVDAVEFDVHLSRDGVPVVLHDPTLDRTTDARGPVRERSVAELARVDAGARFSPDGGRSFPFRGAGIHVPTLEEVLGALSDLPLIIELKTVEVARPALDLLRRTGQLGRVLIGSFLDEALLPFRAAGVPVSAGSSTLARRYVPALLGHRPAALPFQALCIPRYHRILPLPVGAFAAMMRDAGGPTHVWTVNEPAQARRLWRLGVAGIISDDPGLILRTRAQEEAA